MPETVGFPQWWSRPAPPEVFDPITNAMAAIKIYRDRNLRPGSAFLIAQPYEDWAREQPAGADTSVDAWIAARVVALGYGRAGGATVPGMAHAVGSAVPVKILDNVESEDQARVKNDGPSSVVIAKDPLVAPTGADAFVVAANTEETVFLRPGEALYAICSSGQTASVEVI